MAGLLLVAGAMARLRLPAVPFADPDTWGYLHPALSLLTQGEFVHTHAREFLYPTFVYALLRVFDDYAAITRAQHLLGLVTFLVLLAAWRHVPCPRDAGAVARGAHRCLGLVVAGSYLLSAKAIEFEHSLRPESIYPLGLAILLHASLRLLALERSDPKAARTLLVFGTAALFATCVLGMLRPQALPLIPLCAILVGWVAARVRPLPRTLVAVFALPAALSFALLWYPERVLAARDPAAARFVPAAVLFWHMDLVAPVLEADLADPRLEAPGRQVRLLLLDAYHAERARHAAVKDHRFASLGFDPENLLYGGTGRALRASLEGNPEDVRAFCVTTFRRAVLSQPLAYAAKVLRELRAYYGLEAEIYPLRHTIDVADRLRYARSSLARYESTLTRHPASAAYQEALAAAPAAPVAALGATALAAPYAAWYRELARLHLPALVCALGVALLARRDAELSRPSRAALLVATYAFGPILSAAASQSLFVLRYVHAQTALSLFAEGSLLFLLAVGAERAWKDRRRGARALTARP